MAMLELYEDAAGFYLHLSHRHYCPENDWLEWAGQGQTLLFY